MRRFVTVSFYQRRGGALALTAVAAGALLCSALIYRAYIAARSTSVVCTKIHRLDVALETIIDQAQPTRRQLEQFAYYRQHPAELQATLARARVVHGHQAKLLHAADCATGG